ncbi:MAG: hypothetical protein PVF47_00045 [Anaerolineae bacterium]
MKDLGIWSRDRLQHSRNRPWENAAKAGGGVIVVEIARANHQALSR